MVGTIELDPNGQLLLIRFPYREDLIDVVRTLPGRRWDPGAKAWTVHASNIDAVVATLIAHGFEMDSAVSAMFAGTVPKPDKPARREPAAEGEAGAPPKRTVGRRPFRRRSGPAAGSVGDKPNPAPDAE